MTESNPAPVAKPVTHATAHKPGQHGHTHHAATHHTRTAHHSGSFHHHVTSASHRTANHTADATPTDVTEALRTAMAKEGVPPSWESGLHYIMERESTGKVGASNGVDTARGLFQLTKSSYHLNPNGAASFGNAVEEAQGGIRYISERYKTADNAVGFWKRHGWY